MRNEDFVLCVMCAFETERVEMNKDCALEKSLTFSSTNSLRVIPFAEKSHSRREAGGRQEGGRREHFKMVPKSIRESVKSSYPLYHFQLASSYQPSLRIREAT